jgi:glycosyltransferase involved in cell wall biosynthesis
LETSAALKVVHVTFDMRIGGTEQVIRNLIEAPTPDIEHRIFCIEQPLGPWGKALRQGGVPIACVNRRTGFDTSVVRALRRHLQQTGADIVHCHQYTPWTYGSLAALGTRAKVIFTEHGRFHPDRASPKRRFVNPLLGLITRRITAISEATKQALVDYEYLPARRIDVIYNGIKGLTTDPRAAAALKAELGIPPSAPVIGTVARLDPIKNHTMMLRALRQLLDWHPDCRLLLVGDGEERPRIERLIGELGLDEQVVMPGYIADPRVWMDAMDIFLLPSLSEGTSMTLLEAMSLGKPCVVTRVGGNPEIVEDGESGYVVPNDDARALAETCHALLKAPDKAANAGAAAKRRFAEHFERTGMAYRYGLLYRSLCPDPSG